MYKERVKAGINPIWAIPVWAVGIYALGILWGIVQILIEFSAPYVMQIFLFVVTFLFGWYLVSKFITEYEITISSRYITVTKFLGKKNNSVLSIRGQNILCITDDKQDLKKYKISKSENFIRAFQKGNTVYIVCSDNSGNRLVKMKLSGTDARHIADKIKKEGN